MRGWLAFALALSCACATFSVKTADCPSLPQHGTETTVKVQYLGSGGYLVQRGQDVVLFGPVYSNPSLIEVTFDHQIRTDTALVDALLPAEAKQATAIVIGHSHYDHAMDTPYIASVTGATVYGSATLKNLLASVISSVDVGRSVGTFIPLSPRMRLWPIRSQHSDQSRLPIIGPVHLWRGTVQTPQPLPTTASQWAEGEVYAYVLELLDDAGVVEFRLYYQDSGTDEPVGYPVNMGRFDLALLCAGGDFHHLKNHPAGILTALQPRYAVLGHWEDFFHPQTDGQRSGRVMAIPELHVKTFLARASEAMPRGRPLLACPTASVFHFPIR